MTKKEWYYNVYLKSDEWQELRRQVIQKYENKCACCGSGENLNVHHISYADYDKGEKDDVYNLICLCKDCHFYFHEIKKQQEQELESFKNSARCIYQREMLCYFKKWYIELQKIQAKSAVLALQGHKTKHLAKLQKYYSFTPTYFLHSMMNDFINGKDLKERDTMQYISEMRKEN